MIYKCNKCGKYFDECATEKSTFESEYGLTHEFNTSTTCYLDVCPHCNSDDFHEVNSQYNHDFALGELADYFGESEVIDFLNEGV
ncbi:MAG: hypothetical protein ACOX1F_00930 [Erysipelotrichaceae bacterium]|jgi:hypothetical protein